MEEEVEVVMVGVVEVVDIRVEGEEEIRDGAVEVVAVGILGTTLTGAVHLREIQEGIALRLLAVAAPHHLAVSALEVGHLMRGIIAAPQVGVHLVERDTTLGAAVKDHHHHLPEDDIPHLLQRSVDKREVLVVAEVVVLTEAGVAAVEVGAEVLRGDTETDSPLEVAQDRGVGAEPWDAVELKAERGTPLVRAQTTPNLHMGAMLVTAALVESQAGLGTSEIKG